MLDWDKLKPPFPQMDPFPGVLSPQSQLLVHPFSPKIVRSPGLIRIPKSSTLLTALSPSDFGLRSYHLAISEEGILNRQAPLLARGGPFYPTLGAFILPDS
jgi:hypothetical protein